KNKSEYCANSNGKYQGNWHCMGPFINSFNTDEERSGRIQDIWVSQDEDTVLAGSTGGGLWKSTNGGQDWANITDAGSETVNGTIGVWGIAVNPIDHAIIYLATGVNGDVTGKSTLYSAGLVYTTNGGATWDVDDDVATLAGAVNGLAGELITRVKYMPN